MSLNGLDGLLQIAAALGYLAASVYFGAHLTLRKADLAAYARLTAWVAVFFHTVAIGIHCALTRQTPFTTPAETLSALAWTVALGYLGLDLLLRPKPTALGAFALPAAFLCLFTGTVLHQSHSVAAPVVEMLDSRIISLHVIAILFAFGLLVLAFGCALLYLVQHRILKRKRIGGLFGKLPSLSSLETQAFTLVAFAFPLLTVGLVSGLIKAAGGGMQSGWMQDHKILFSLVTWLVYGVYLGLHGIAHWRGLRANYFLIGGLLFALMTYFIPTTAHRFG